MMTPSAVAAAEDRPNVVFIMTDDQGAWSLGCYGNTEAVTPNIDRLARGGVRFTRAFATIPVCSPSRATFTTGRLPSQHGIHDWIKHENTGPRARYCLVDEYTISDILAEYGYTCGISGKWHLGDSFRRKAGFTYWYVLPTGGSKYQDAEMYRHEESVQTQGYLTDRITDGAIAFLDQHHEKPFYLEVQYNAPHTPYEGHPQELRDLFADCRFESIPKLPPHPWASSGIGLLGRREPMVAYFAACAGIDRGVGRVVEHLKQLDLLENTVVIFTSDQGYNIGHRGLWGKGNASNPRNAYDTSLRIPLIFHYPGKFPEGQTCDLMVSAYDFLPTLLEYLDLPPSPGRNLPGRSFAPALRGKSIDDWPDAVFAEYAQLRMIRTHDFKYIHRAHGGPLELYDLKNDPDETTNLADDPKYDERRKQLRARLFEWFDQYVEAGADPVGQIYLRPDQQ
jgi:arylsulfatase A-like enzyme